MPKMPAPDFDCIIAGGGPAGSTAGAFLARAGLRTLIVEKERFPRFHIGESLLPAGNAVLREIGAWEKVEAAGFMRKLGAEFHVGDQPRNFKRIRFRDGMIPGADHTYQVERARFDELLFRHAAELGCETRERTKLSAARELPGGAGWEVTLQAAGGGGPETTTLRAPWLIDATGRDHVWNHALKTDRVDPGGDLPKRAAVYAHFRNVRREPGDLAGNIIIVRHADGWFWLIPLDEERTSVGLVSAVGALRGSPGRKPADIFQETVAASPKLSALMAGAEPTTGFHVTSDYTYRARRFAAERLLLVGDAAGFFDPIFSSGVFLALHGAKLATAEILAAHRHGRTRLTAWQQARYTRRLGRAAGVFQRLILAFYDNASYAVFVDRHPPMRLGAAVNSIVAGHTRLPWRVRWRYAVFLLVCRLQRRWRIVPPIHLEARTNETAVARELASLR